MFKLFLSHVLMLGIETSLHWREARALSTDTAGQPEDQVDHHTELMIINKMFLLKHKIDS